MSANTDNLITLASYPRAICHLDCDAFFTSCEESRDPSLRGKPLVTGQERGIVSCANYVAKARGIKRPMRLGDARKLCSDLKILPGDYELYSIYSRRVFSIIRRFTPDVEEYSIDEAFFDITGLRRIFRGGYPGIALRIKQAVQRELDITVSIGLSCSKTLAKICSKEKKPDGFCAVPGCRLQEFLPAVALERVCGFGPNTVELLSKCGLRTVYDYVARPVSFARKLLGKTGEELWHELRGERVYPLVTEAKESYLTISKTKTFMPASADPAFVKAQLMRNLESACIKLRRHSLSARGLSVYLRRQDFTSSAVESRINRHSSSTLDFSSLCARLFNELFEPGTPYRSTGVIFSDITAEGRDTTDLFEDPVRVERIRRISETIDEVNASFGKHTLHLASAHEAGLKREHTRTAPSWRKDELLPGETARRRLNIPLLKLR